MEKAKFTVIFKRKMILLIMVFLIGCDLCTCGKENRITGEPLVKEMEEPSSVGETKSDDDEAAKQWAKGYNLPVDKQEEKEARNDCRTMMKLIFDIYQYADKGNTLNVVLNNKTILKMQKKLKKTECPVATSIPYSNMENYESVDSFLGDCVAGQSSSVVIYKIHGDGGIGRMKFIFDGTKMYVISAKGVWNADGKPGISYISYTRIKEWNYTEKGWFCYQLCVPEPPEVSEMIDGSCLIRIKPMTEEQREMSERCVGGLGYQGNNILCSNWDADHMEELDFNACWTAMVLDFLPYKVPETPRKKIGWIRYLMFAASLVFVSALFLAQVGNFEKIMFWAFIIGNVLYYTVGIILAFAFKDNRAFCKYICPITVFLKPMSYFSLLRIKCDKSKCISCGKCKKVCPMEVEVTDNSRKRKNGTECILCFECVKNCPKDAL